MNFDFEYFRDPDYKVVRSLVSKERIKVQYGRDLNYLSLRLLINYVIIT
jgi:hypothetical protein